ncbi:MAG: stage II sporulation protein P [Lachnospiraceae bacterium]|nr:stage II sporulation protein P [Lachnospiraceae bacterium]
MLKGLADEAETLLYSQFMPSAVMISGTGGETLRWVREQLDALFPLYGFMTGNMLEQPESSQADIRTILLAEAEEGSYLWDEEEMAENIGTPEPSQEESLNDLLQVENEAAIQMRQQNASSFVPHTIQNQVDLGTLSNYETLIRQFYTVDNNTTAGSDQLNVEKLTAADMRISKDSDGPQILIYHTHSQETFSDSVPGDASTSIMGVGEHLTEILTEEYGYQVLHHLGKYDVDSRDDSYSVALTDIEQILKEYPSIQVVIDLHRDEMPETTRLVMDLDGRPTARFMFFNGLSRTKKTGNIAYLYNENLDSNLAFSFQMQLKAVEYYPGLTRKIYLKGYRYNMHLRPRTLLIELGAQNNTVEEAMNACEPLAHILDMVLSGE